MPTLPIKRCEINGCRKDALTGRKHCEEHAKPRAPRRPRVTSIKSNWYGTAAWRRNRKAQLERQPLCQACLSDNRVTIAEHVDHVEPHKGDKTKFFSSPLQSLCLKHHTYKTHEERKGMLHHWTDRGHMIKKGDEEWQNATEQDVQKEDDCHLKSKKSKETTEEQHLHLFLIL